MIRVHIVDSSAVEEPVAIEITVLQETNIWNAISEAVSKLYDLEPNQPPPSAVRHIVIIADLMEMWPKRAFERREEDATPNLADTDSLATTPRFK